MSNNHPLSANPTEMAEYDVLDLIESDAWKDADSRPKLGLGVHRKVPGTRDGWGWPICVRLPGSTQWEIHSWLLGMDTPEEAPDAAEALRALERAARDLGRE